MDATRNKPWLSWAGLETDLIFNHGIDLPGFAAFPLLNDDTHRALIRAKYQEQMAVAAETGCVACLESLTWVANLDRAAGLGYGVDDLVRINTDAVAFLADMRGDTPAVISAQIGPRGDGYEAGDMSPGIAKDYHMAQIAVLAETACDVLSAFTIGSVDEATGIVQAAVEVGKPVHISFTVETDGRLPDGTPLHDAIRATDDATSGGAALFLVNCAHPTHLEPAFAATDDWQRLGGIVANASRQSHAELDEAEVLDDGNPAELGQQIGALAARLPSLRVFGGCCGTDMRHMREIGAAVAP